MIKTIKKLLFIGLGLGLLLPQLVLADGMVVPPPDYWIQETDQKAVIFYDQGVETLVLSITFEGDADDFGWVVPVPNQPTVEKGSDELFTSLQELTGISRYYAPSDILGLGGVEEKDQGVTIIETKQIEYYDVTVLSSTDKDALTKWLNENGYDFPSSASYILESYIQNQWYFVAMRINAESLEWSDVSQQLRTGHAIPVAISFETKNIVYPLKISSVVSQSDNDTSNGDVTYKDGKINKGIYVDSNDKFSFSATEVISNKGGTIEMWVKPSWFEDQKGYFQLLSVQDKNSGEVLYFRITRDYSTSKYYLQLSSYPEGAKYRIWGSEEIDIKRNEWQHLAVTWQEGEIPVFYLNGEKINVQAKYDSSFSAKDTTDGTLYIGQRLNESSVARSVIDELAIFSKARTAEEILADYNKGVDEEALEVEDDTTFLAHFDSSLKEEKSGNSITYGKFLLDTIWEPYSQSSTVNILLYVFADHKKTLPEFNTTWANWVKKKDIQEMALDDQGNPWIESSKGKYFLTKLTRNMSFSEMTEDLFLRDTDDNKKVGAGASNWDKIKKEIVSLILLALFYFAIIFLASVFSPFGVLFIVGTLLQFLSKKRTAHVIAWILQGLAIFFYIVTIIMFFWVPVFGSTLLETARGIPLYSISSATRDIIGLIIVLIPILVFLAMMAMVMFLQIRHQRKK